VHCARAIYFLNKKSILSNIVEEKKFPENKPFKMLNEHCSYCQKIRNHSKEFTIQGSNLLCVMLADR